MSGNASPLLYLGDSPPADPTLPTYDAVQLETVFVETFVTATVVTDPALPVNMAEYQDNLVDNGAAARILPDAAAAAALAALSDVDEEPPLANCFLEPVVLRPGRFTFAKKELLALSGLFLLDPLVTMPQVVD
jgi:hypothetical protein